MNKNYLKMIPFVILLVILALMIRYELTHNEPTYFPPSITRQEFIERYDDEPVVEHFKAKYPMHGLSWNRFYSEIFPSWGYATGKNYETRYALLQLWDNFGKYEFIYVCGNNLADPYVYVKITNPSIEDIDNIDCYDLYTNTYVPQN